jgi:D-alanyl-D-alanine carboxypeptidase
MDFPELPADYPARMPWFVEETNLVPVGNDFHGRPIRLRPDAATAWEALRDDAARAGHVLVIISAFRGYADQECIIRRKLERGLDWAEILRYSAYPGFSEHHTGRVVDLGTPDRADLTEAFESTPAFRWLQENAARHGFRLSYPRDNPTGIAYEPWHWAYEPPEIPAAIA